MAREKVIKVTCDRCGRDEFMPEPKDVEKKKALDLDVTFMGKNVQFPDLCSVCRKTCENLFNSMNKDMKNVSPERTVAKKGGPGEGPPETTENSSNPSG